jgi:signal transduction histidine kinase
VSWLFFAWHLALPAAIIAYARLRGTPEQPQKLLKTPGRTIFAVMIATLAMAAGMTWLATAQSDLIAAVLDALPDYSLHYASMLLCIAAMTLVWRQHRSILDIGLMLTLWAMLLEFILVLPGAARYSAGWYAGRASLLLSDMFVLLMLLIEMSRLYARTVTMIAAQTRERENRLMLGEAVGGFIAHELRQPLAAIGLNAYTAQKLGVGSELAGVLDDLMQGSRHANDVIESTRALFAKAGNDRRPTDINQLVRDTLLMASHELRNRQVRVEMMLDERLPLVPVNRLQMQQVFLNLFLNAAEAMSGVSGRPRALTIRSSSGDVGLVIRVEDTGPSIAEADEDRIFDPFFTTKTHGTGMGLSICRSVVQAHGGSIQMAHRMPFGVCFEILLPAAGLTPAAC